MDGNSIMPFGKHKDKKLSQVPAGWFMWYWKEACHEICNEHSDELCKYIFANLEKFKKQKKANAKFYAR